MEHLEIPTGRRTFLKKGIIGGFMAAVFPLLDPFQPAAGRSKSIPPRHDYSQYESHQKLLEIIETYGGEFGDTQGGL